MEQLVYGLQDPDFNRIIRKMAVDLTLMGKLLRQTESSLAKRMNTPPEALHTVRAKRSEMCHSGELLDSLLLCPLANGTFEKVLAAQSALHECNAEAPLLLCPAVQGRIMKIKSVHCLDVAERGSAVIGSCVPHNTTVCPPALERGVLVFRACWGAAAECNLCIAYSTVSRCCAGGM